MRIILTRQVIETIEVETAGVVAIAQRETVETVTLETVEPRPEPFRAPLRDVGQTVLAQFSRR